MKHSLTLRERINHYSQSNEQTGCVEWTGATAGGYGLIRNPSTRKNEYAHRIAYQLEHGPLVSTHKGLPSQVLHKCDNPLCVAPSHLFLGNHDTNMKDKVAKGRQNLTGKKRGKNLTDAERIEIHKLLDEGLSNYKVAQQTKRSETHISRIRRAYNEQKKQDGQTKLLKDVNARLADLLFPGRKKPCGSTPDPGAIFKGGKSA